MIIIWTHGFVAKNVETVILYREFIIKLLHLIITYTSYVLQFLMKWVITLIFKIYNINIQFNTISSSLSANTSESISGNVN